MKFLVTAAIVVYLSSCAFNFWLGRESTHAERDGLRATIAALRAADGDGSCAVARDGPRVLCALRGDRLQRAALADGDVICAVLKNRDRAECTLADGRRVTLRREATRRRP